MKITTNQIRAKLDLFNKDLTDYGTYNIEEEATRAIIFELALEALGHSPSNILATLEVN